MDKQIRILHIIEPWSSGVVTHVEQLTRALESKEFHCAVVCPPQSLLPQLLSETGVEVWTLPMWRGLAHQDYKSVIGLYRILSMYSFDLIHLHSFKAGIIGRPLGRLFNLPVVFSPHVFSFVSQRENSLGYQLALLIERVLGRLVDRLICVSPSERELAIKHRIVPPEQITLIPTFVDLNKWKPRLPSADLKRELAIRSDTLVVGTVTRYWPQKAPLDFARMAKQIVQLYPNITFLIRAEDGPIKGKFEQYIHEHQLERFFVLLGRVQDMAEVVALMDIFVLTSLWEGLPATLIEAMSMGRPVIATDIPGTREIINSHNCGILVPAGSPKEMAHAVVRLIQDPALRLSLGENGRRAVESNYSLEMSVAFHKNVYRDLVLVHRNHSRHFVSFGKEI